jgi:hypothetical protein
MLKTDGSEAESSPNHGIKAWDHITLMNFAEASSDISARQTK